MLSLNELMILINLVEHDIDYEIENRKYDAIIRDDKIRDLEILRNKLVKKYNGKIEKLVKKYGGEIEKKRGV